MKIAIIGATGARGAKLVNEALSRGHSVTGIARNPEKLAAKPNLTMKKGDVADEAGLTKLLAGHDVVISAVHFLAFDHKKMLAAVKKSGVKRYLVVGGAGSLEVKPGLRLVDTPEFPAVYKGEALSGGEYLKLLQGEKELNWTFLSPSAVLAPGPRTGKYKLGKDQLLTGPDGKSFISDEDYVIAMIDEAEKHKHPRQRFTVGY